MKSLLYNLARGHAIVHNRRKLNEDDVVFVSKIALSSMQDDRREVIKLLLGEEIIGTNEICEILNIDSRTARSIMKALEVLGVVNVSEEGRGSQYYIELSDDFKNFRDDTSSLSGLMMEVIGGDGKNGI